MISSEEQKYQSSAGIQHIERKDNKNDDLLSNTHTNKADIRLQLCVFAALQNTAAVKNNQPVIITTYMWLLFLQLLSDKQLGLLLISSSLWQHIIAVSL